MSISLKGIDHFVLTVRSIERTVEFYRDVLGFEEITFGNRRKALKTGSQKFNLHQAGAEIKPHAKVPTSGSADFCLIYSGKIEDIEDQMNMMDITIEEGPVSRTGANGPIRSIYIRDPDDNLVELSVY